MSHSNSPIDNSDDYNKIQNQFTSLSSTNDKEDDKIDNDNNIFNSLMKIKSTETPTKNMIQVPNDASLVETIQGKPTTFTDSNVSSTGAKRSHSQASLNTTIESLKDELLAQEETPICLKATSASFQNFIQQANMNSTGDINIDDLRHIAFLMYQNKKLDLEKSLWSTILKSGMGILKTEEANVKMWPELLQNMIRSCYVQQNVNEIVTDRICFSVTYSLLRHIEHRYQYYHDKVNEKMKSIIHRENGLGSILQTFIQTHIQPIQTEYEYKIALITTDYEDQRLAYEIEKLQQQELNENQKAIIEKLCSLRYRSEKAKFDVQVLELYVKQGKLPGNFEPMNLKFPTYIDILQDQTQRQQYISQHQRIIENYQQEMILLFLNISKAYMSETETLINKEMNQFWRNQQSIPVHQRFPPIVLNLLEKRLENQAEKAKYVHQYELATNFG